MHVGRLGNSLYIPPYKLVATSHRGVPKTGQTLWKALNALLPMSNYVAVKPMLEIATLVVKTLQLADIRDVRPDDFRVVVADSPSAIELATVELSDVCQKQVFVIDSFTPTDDPRVNKMYRTFVSERPTLELYSCGVLPINALKRYLNV